MIEGKKDMINGQNYKSSVIKDKHKVSGDRHEGAVEKYEKMKVT